MRESPSEQFDEAVRHPLNFRLVSAAFRSANALRQTADHELCGGSFECRAGRAELLNDRVTVTAFVDHRLNGANLTLDACQSGDDLARRNIVDFEFGFILTGTRLCRSASADGLRFSI